MPGLTLADALTDLLAALGVRELEGLADVLGISRPPQRKAELLDRVRAAYTDRALRGLWDRLSGIDRAAVSEVVHSEDHALSVSAFVAKYGTVPVWGSLDARGSNRPSALHAFFPIRRSMPGEIKVRLRAFVPAPQPARLEAATARRRFLEDTERRASNLVDAGEARLFECADAALALGDVDLAGVDEPRDGAQLAQGHDLRLHDRDRRVHPRRLLASNVRARGACILAGERHLVVPVSAEQRFRGALRGLGYGVSPTGRVGGA